MKKLFITAVLALATMTFANAQWYVGGNIDFDYGSTKVGDADAPSTMGLDFIPRVGYMFNDRMSVGLGLNLAYDSFTTYDAAGEKTTDSAFGFGVTPFFRYSIYEYRKFALVGELSVPLMFGQEFQGAQKGDIMNIGVRITPVVTYDFNTRMTFELGIDLFNLGFAMNKFTPDVDGALDQKETTFGLGWRNDVFNTIGNITLGVYYKF